HRDLPSFPTRRSSDLIQANRTRMLLLGNRVLPPLLVAYAVSAAFAGVAGAVLTQTTNFVGLRGLSLDVTFDGIVMVVLGGVGTLDRKSTRLNSSHSQI